MKIKKILTSFVIGFASTLVASSIVTFLWSLGFHETAKIDWETSFRLAVILGFILPVIEARKDKSEV